MNFHSAATRSASPIPLGFSHQHQVPSSQNRRMSNQSAGGHHGKEDPYIQKQTRPAFRRPRAGRACGTCHTRRVRCDAGSHGLPCTNCIAFSLDCAIPEKKKKKRDGETASSKRAKQRGRANSTRTTAPETDLLLATPDDFASLILQADQHIKQQPDDTSMYAKLVNPVEEPDTPIEDPGRVAYLQEFSNMSLIVDDLHGPHGVHHPLPKCQQETLTVSTAVNEVELNILRQRGALILPPKNLCDQLVHAYFEWVAPVVPIINKAQFMKRYQDPSNPPSILLMQAILLAGSRVCTTELLMDSNGSPIPAATLFYTRAKALYDADYELDRVATVQALILMGWYWEDPAVVTKNVYYWNGLAVAVAHGSGMHRTTKRSRLTEADQKLWKRIWWTLYTRDRSVAVALGQSTHINTADCDVEDLCPEDFQEDGSKPNAVHVQFFLEYIKICQIVDKVLLQNYSISARARRQKAMALTECDQALANWHQNCAEEVRWDPQRYCFWSAYLHCNYQTTICLLHRAHLPSAPAPYLYNSLMQSPAFYAARIITSIVGSLMAHNELRYVPPFIIYSLLSTLIVHIYLLHITEPAAIMVQMEQISICMRALEGTSEIWLVAKAVRSLFEAILKSTGFDINLYDSNRFEAANEPRGFNAHKSHESWLSNSAKWAKDKKSPLTPALQEWLDTAFKSASGPPPSESSNPTDHSSIRSHRKSSNDSISTSKSFEPPPFNLQLDIAQYPTSHGRFQNFQVPPLASQQMEDPQLCLQRYLNYLPEGQEIMWEDPYNQIPVPAPTGSNALEWFQFFGIQ